MKIEVIKLTKIPNPKGKTLAFVSFRFDELIEINDARLIKGSNGLFIGWPSQKITGEDGDKYKNHVYVKDRDFSKLIAQAAEAAYDKQTVQQQLPGVENKDEGWS